MNTSKTSLPIALLCALMAGAMVILAVAYYRTQNELAIMTGTLQIRTIEMSNLIRRLEERVKTQQMSHNDFDTSIWKIYRNDKYGFELKYPSDWSYLDTGKPYIIAFFPPGKKPDLKLEYFGDIFIDVASNPQLLDFETFYKVSESGNFFEAAESGRFFNVGEFKAVKLANVPGYLPSTMVILEKESFMFEISDFDNHNQSNGIFDALISSFKFIN